MGQGFWMILQSAIVVLASIANNLTYQKQPYMGGAKS
jgi:hypothetical protein